MARWLYVLALATMSLGSGCCCFPCGGGYRLPPPIMWNGACSECGPSAGQSCASCGGCRGPFALFPGLGHCLSCGKGCGEVYIGEWASDPPDCCDPCDKCNGQFVGQQGPCCLGPAQRILAAFHGYSYCPPPNCGPWCPIIGNCCLPCSMPCGNGCGGYGYGGPDMPHGGDIYYDGAPMGPPAGGPGAGMPQPAQPSQSVQPESTSILNENWDAPRPKPEPGRPIHNARQPAPRQMSYRLQPRPRTGERRQGSAAQASAQMPAGYRQPVGAGVRQTEYQR
jgi:hypothetical protein